MIFKDHVQWPSQSESDQKEFAVLKKEFQDIVGRKWPISLKWHPSRVKKIIDTESPGGYRIEKPPESLIDLQWTANGIDKMPHVWTYCENYEPDPLTKKNKYYPISRPFSGFETFPESKFEFLLWLYIAYPNLQGGRNESKSQNEIVFDLPHLEKIKNVEYDTLYGQVLALITNPQFGKPIDELKMMLTSYFVPGVDKMEDFDVRDELKRKATEGNTPQQQMESMKLFLSRDSDTDRTKIRFLCQKAIEARLIEYVSKRMVWVHKKGNEESGVIAKVTFEQVNEKNQILYETMAARISPENRELLALLEERFMSKKDDVHESEIEENVIDDELPQIETEEKQEVPVKKPKGFQKRR